MLIYNNEIKELLDRLEEVPIGEACEGHPEDDTVLEEYYLWDIPRDPQELIKNLKNIIHQKFELWSNVLTIYKFS